MMGSDVRSGFQEWDGPVRGQSSLRRKEGNLCSIFEDLVGVLYSVKPSEAFEPLVIFVNSRNGLESQAWVVKGRVRTYFFIEQARTEHAHRARSSF